MSYGGNNSSGFGGNNNYSMASGGGGGGGSASYNNAAAATANASSAALFMTLADFESLKHDPMAVLERATQFIALLSEKDRELAEENKLLQQQLRSESDRVTFNSEQHANLVENAAELELDHRELSQKYVDIELINKNLQGLVDALRNDKQILTDELSSLKSQQQGLVHQYSSLLTQVGEAEELRGAKESQLKVQQEEIDVKIKELDAYSKKVIEETMRTIELQHATERIGSARLSLESETTALEQTTQQQERTLAYYQHEVTFFDAAINQKANEMVQLKKQMSAAVLELQLQITKSEEEMSRIRTMVQNENDLTGRQNLWLAKDLKSKLQELIITRQEMTKDNAELKSQLASMREKSSRLKSNVLVVEKRNQAFHDTLKRLEAEDALVKDNYLNRKDAAYHELNEQAVKIQRINQELQTAREDLYTIKSRLCKHCRMSILHTASESNVGGTVPAIGAGGQSAVQGR